MPEQHFIVKINKKITNAIYALLILFLLTFTGSVGTIFYWMYYPYKPLEIHALRLLETPKLGQTLHYEIEYTKHDNLSAMVTRELVNSHAIIFPTLVSHVPVTGSNVKKIKQDELSLTKLYPDTYYFKWSATYQVNPIRTVTVSARTECFALK